MPDPVQVSLGDLSRLRNGELHVVHTGTFAVLVCRVKGRLYAIDDRCSHAAASLGEGRLHGFEVACPLHGARFDVRTGRHTRPPARCGVASYPIVEGPAGAVLTLPAGEAGDIGG